MASRRARALTDRFLDAWAVLSGTASAAYAQEGEDIIIAHLTHGMAPSIYVDVGAHHPRRFSNTHKLWRNGWAGINVDARPGTKILFDRLRPQDLNVECGVAGKPGKLNFFMFDDAALNTFDPSRVGTITGEGYQLEETIAIPVRTLASIIHEAGDLIPAEGGLLSIDVEGLDEEVLKSHDWGRWRPDLVVVEEGTRDRLLLAPSQLLKQQGYTRIANTPRSSFYVRA